MGLNTHTTDQQRSGSRAAQSGIGAAPLLRFIAGAVGGLIAFAAVYWAFVQTEAGQRLENLALAGAAFRDPGEVDGSLQSLSQISVLSFAGALFVVLLVAMARRKWRLALLGVLVMGVSIVVAELLKDLLPRPALVVAPSWLLRNTFPSGHATIAVAIGVGALLVAPERVRWLVLPLAAAYAAVIAQAVQIAGWHRLSGTLGAAFLVLSVASIALAAFAARGYVGPARGPRPYPRIRRALLVIAGALVLAAALVAVLPIGFPVLHAPAGADSAFAHTVLDLVGTGMTLFIVVVFDALIEPFSFDAHAAEPYPPTAPEPSAS